MSSTAKLKADLKRESKKEKISLEETFVGERESYQKEVEDYESAVLEVFNEFWRANPNTNFGYLKNQICSEFFDYCAMNKPEDEARKSNESSSVAQNQEDPTAQDQVHGTPMK
uniref:Uncharacterized protein n=1 Tax=Cannabis sativa TaxID=3483 RepID=A0A803QGC9_CANSA